MTAREAELIAREEELVDLRLRVAAADDEIQVWCLERVEGCCCERGGVTRCLQRLREIVEKGPELRTYK
jgi:hypothetical protein